MDAFVSIFRPLAQQLSYLFDHMSKFQDLRSKVQDLKYARERVQQSVDLANSNGEEILVDVKRWLTQVNEKISDRATAQLLEDEETAMMGCFSGFCPDFKSRYLLSKKAEREADAIAQLLNRKDKLDRFYYRPGIEEYEAFGSRSGVFDGVMAALEDDTINIIGLYGVGGVGKTTLVKEVAGQAKKKLLFDEVVFVAVTQTRNTVHIQNEIACKLGTARLHHRLKKAKKVLIILDDIREEHEVDTLGIPSADQHKGCKILITSRFLDVLVLKGSQKSFEIGVLEEDEAWNLFTNVAGHIAESSALQSTAKKVAQKCAGLPLAITTVAKALKHKENPYEWEDALEQLKPSEINYRGISGAVYSAIEMSYNYLEREEHKYTFLLCSTMSHNAVIEDLLKYCRGLGLFHGLDTMETVRRRVLALVSKLKDSSLLLSGSTLECFDMHDVVRDVAISIASRDHHWLALGNEDAFEEWSNEDTMREFNLVSLSYAKVSELPDELACPNLTFFSMHGTMEVPNNFFKGMQRLKVLEFADMHFTSLPSSLGSLKTLCTLRLIDCALEDIIMLGELGNLEILDLRGSRTRVLPEEIGQLTRLKLLDLTDCYNLEIISLNVLSKLSALEELYLYDSFDGWEVEGIENLRNNASLVELQHLSRLTTLEVHIPDVEAIPKDNLFFGKMERYKISIGDEEWHWHGDDRRMETSRMLKLKSNKNIHLVDGFKLLFGKTQSLYLDGLVEGGEMLYDPNAESFGQLRFIKVQNCSMLKNLFSFSAAKRLCQLEELEVSNCENILELIVEKEEISENDILEFSKLWILKLDNLNRFNGLWYSENTCQSVTWLFDKKVSCPALEELYLNSVGGIEEIWHIDDQLPLMSFGVQSLTCLEVYKCCKLKYVFTSSMVKSFVHLKTLEISECDEMEGVIDGVLAATEEERTSGSISVFPKLDSLKLENLTRLNRFCCGINPIDFLELRDLMISGCPDLNTFDFDTGKSRETLPHYLFNEKVSCPALEKLELYSVTGIEKIWHIDDQLPLMSIRVRSLTSLRVEKCHKLKHVFTSSMVKSFVRLKKLVVSECDEMEGVMEGIIAATEEGISMNIRMFPKLESLQLAWLPKLKRFCCGINPIEFPSLRSLKIRECHDLNIFTFDIGTMPHYLFNEKVSCPALEDLHLDSVSGIEKIWHIDDQLPLMRFGVRSLTYLKVYNCHNLKYVFTSSMVKSFVHLKTLFVSRCDEMEGVIDGVLAATEEERTSGSISVFPKLDSLELLWLPKLKRFCCGTNPIEFPSLRITKTWHCPELNTFDFDVEQNRKGLPQYFFNEKVILPVLEELDIYKSYNLERLWPAVLAEHSFFRLTSIDLKDCPKLSTVFPLNMLTRLQRLNMLRICDCVSVEEIIFGSESQGGGISSAMPSLSSPFIQSDVLTFEFPSLASLTLERLPNLTSIHHKMHTANWPSLKEMTAGRCDKVEILLASQETSGKSSRQPLFWVNETTFPNLHRLTLAWNAGIKEIIRHGEGQQQRKLLSRYFRSLKVVILDKYPEQVTIMPSYLFQLFSFPNLQTLEIMRSSFKEILQSEEVGPGDEEKPASLLLSRITELKLVFLSGLMHLWKETEVLQNLRILHVESCTN